MEEPSLLHQALTRVAERDPARPLLLTPRTIYTYGEAEWDANRVARALHRLGIKRGDRVALLWRNAPEYVHCFFGILRLGAIAVPINHSIDARGLQHLLDDSGAKALIAEAAFATGLAHGLAEGRFAESLLLSDKPEAWGTARAKGLAAALNAESDASWPEVALVGAAATSDAVSSSDPAAIIYTSGSTGKPRGAVLSHRSLIANTVSIVQYLELTAEDRVMAVLPFFYVYGQSLLNTHVWAGGSLIVGSDLLFPNAVLSRMVKEEATGFSGVPSTFAILLHRSKLAATPLTRLRYVTQAGGAMAPDLTRRLVDALPTTRVFVMYGATEASARLSYLDPKDLSRKIGSIGKAIPGVELRVLRDDGAPCAPGETGELVARGDNIMLGYWNAPEETAAVLDGAGFHTGDLAYADDEGFFYVVGRKREMIKCGANRISPLEIEQALLEHGTVHEAAVVGVPDEIMGEAIVAFVAPRAGERADPEALLSFLSERLPEYKVPKAIELRAELPKSGAGKIQKLALREEWLAANEGA